MQIDPRIMKEVVRMGVLNGVDILPGTASKAKDKMEDGIDFLTLFESMIGSAGLEETGTSSLQNDVWKSNPLMPLNQTYVPITEGKSKLPLSGTTEYNNLIEQASKKFGVDASLIKGVIHAESGFKADVVSHAGAKGLMQLMDSTARGLGVTNSFDPEQNVMGGTRFLAGLLRKYQGNVGMALAGYNAGPGRVDALGVSNDAELREKLHLLPQETQQYVTKVLNYKASYAAQPSI